MTGFDPARVNPRHITWALDAIGAEGPEVDIACGAVEPAVDRWESGEEVPTEEQLHRLAALTGLPVEFFLAEDDPGPSVMMICQRSGRGRGCTRIVDGVEVDSPDLRRKARGKARREQRRDAQSNPAGRTET